MPLAVPAVLAAADKLRGHLVQSPVIGSVMLGGDGRVDVRWKADMLQPGGTAWFRGYQHLLLRSFGALPGVAFAGPSARVLAAAIAAQQHRLPFVAFVGVSLPSAIADGVAATGGAVEVVADPAAAAAKLQRAKGYLPLPGLEHPEVAAGVATVGLELGQAMPAECSVVYVALEAARAAEVGLAAAGRTPRVVGVGGEEPAAAAAPRVAAAVACAHRLQLSQLGATVLAAAMAHSGPGPVGALVLE